MAPRFQYKNLDSALRYKERDWYHKFSVLGSTNPKSFGQHTKLALYGISVHRRSEFNNLAIELAQNVANNILSARHLLEMRDDESLPSQSVNTKSLVKNLKGLQKYADSRQYRVLGEKAEEIGQAVVKDFGFTLEEACKLHTIYQDEFESPPFKLSQKYGKLEKDMWKLDEGMLDELKGAIKNEFGYEHGGYKPKDWRHHIYWTLGGERLGNMLTILTNPQHRGESEVYNQNVDFFNDESQNTVDRLNKMHYPISYSFLTAAKIITPQGEKMQDTNFRDKAIEYLKKEQELNQKWLDETQSKDMNRESITDSISANEQIIQNADRVINMLRGLGKHFGRYMEDRDQLRLLMDKD